MMNAEPTTLGNKIKQVRTDAGLTQEQFAEKLYVSRQAVTKWEGDRGLPDIENLKAIASLFDVSVDTLLKDEELSLSVVVEPINLAEYHKGGRAKNAYDAVVIAKYPQAAQIVELVRQHRNSFRETVIELVADAGGIFGLGNQLADTAHSYFAVLPSRTLFVTVTKERVEARDYTGRTDKRTFVFGPNRYYRGRSF
ncbi:MAG: helix-turn-helix domain-containing protein [Propionibacteriaceae bacterium]|jgi:transcriptional regulator with XRE-family HTH domain|nr:helix-turn-helix domain-containing protein [Propionibacteriaceae bacterium]